MVELSGNRVGLHSTHCLSGDVFHQSECLLAIKRQPPDDWLSDPILLPDGSGCKSEPSPGAAACTNKWQLWHSGCQKLAGSAGPRPGCLPPVALAQPADPRAGPSRRTLGLVHAAGELLAVLARLQGPRPGACRRRNSDPMTGVVVAAVLRIRRHDTCPIVICIPVAASR
jgi:hypothetical protein